MDRLQTRAQIPDAMSPSKLLQYEDQRARRRGIIKMNRASSQVISKPLPPLITGIKKQQQQQQIKVPENQRNNYQQPVIIYTHSPKLIHTRPHDFMSLVQKLTGFSHDHNPDQDMELLQRRSRDNSRDDHIEYASSSSSSSSLSSSLSTLNNTKNNTINYSSSTSTSSSSSVSDLSAPGFDHHHHQYPLIAPPLSFMPNSELFFCSSSGSGYGSPFCYSSAYQEPAGVFISTASIDDDPNINNIGTIANISPSFLEVNIEGSGFPVDYSY